MSKSKTNLLTHGFSGIVGKQYVMKQRNGQQIIASRPKRNPKVYSESQRETRKLFSMAVDYARRSMKNPELRAEYALRGEGRMSAYTAAVTDFYRLPWINAIETDRYHGAAGEIISVAAGDYFKVTEVTVTIKDAAGILVETGKCDLNEISGKWVYVATTGNPNLLGTTIKAVVRDLPDHAVEHSVIL